MATIELDIIKQRSDKLTPEEKLDLIDFLTASLSSEDIRHDSKPFDNNVGDDLDALLQDFKAT